MVRHIVLRIGTGELCADPDQYQVAVQERWAELYGQLSNASAAFYRGVREVCNIECEATYERWREGGRVQDRSRPGRARPLL